MLSTIIQNCDKWLWENSPKLARTRRVLQVLVLMVRCIMEDPFRERAQALAYTTLLSLVPLVAVSFSILKGFGVHFELQPILLKAFSPLGAAAPDAVQTLIQFVENVNAKVLGGIGLVFLFYTVISLLTSIESAFNGIWGITKGRKWNRRITDYLIIVLTGPVLFFALISVLSNKWVDHYLIDYISTLGINSYLATATTLALLTLIFTFAYSFITHRQIHLIPALSGGFIAATSWLILGKIFANFVATSANYSGIYSGFASIIIFMLWTYISWLIVLLGNQLAFFIQYPEYILASKFAPEQPQQIKLEITIEQVNSKIHQFEIVHFHTQKININSTNQDTKND